MKARLPQGFSNGGGTNLQQLARQAQKLQEEMDAANSELEQKEYSATVGGNAVTAVVTGKMEVKSLEIKPEVVDPEDIDMLSELVIAAVNEAIRAASTEKAENYGKIIRWFKYAGYVLIYGILSCRSSGSIGGAV